ncbi:MAG TPA: aspartyl-phosphate phosphatase Spo0E family protein [Clostridium sp.]|uniref:aspartyl-phosphate phosphatase Spo0E family protein n=1 Tax=Clostridium sp. TaxID=1506 RepID=UPI002F945789
MDEKIELLRKRLENLISESDRLINDEVIKLSQELDKYISQYYSGKVDVKL